MSGIHFDIKFYQNLAREALANEIKARTGDGSVRGENVITWINENIQTAAANGSDIVNAWEHAYVSAYIYLQLHD